jgi:hypothetical protein
MRQRAASAGSSSKSRAVCALRMALPRSTRMRMPSGLSASRMACMMRTASVPMGLSASSMPAAVWMVSGAALICAARAAMPRAMSG